mmetsp:Transcript_32488/g.76467  ORF Transcript_32488/g.76467 Transcript_32488/m.76467 type:complete len:259 (-) Transcript_32488:207-983(-)
MAGQNARAVRRTEPRRFVVAEHFRSLLLSGIDLVAPPRIHPGPAETTRLPPGGLFRRPGRTRREQRLFAPGRSGHVPILSRQPVSGSRAGARGPDPVQSRPRCGVLGRETLAGPGVGGPGGRGGGRSKRPAGPRPPPHRGKHPPVGVGSGCGYRQQEPPKGPGRRFLCRVSPLRKPNGASLGPGPVSTRRSAVSDSGETRDRARSGGGQGAASPGQQRTVVADPPAAGGCRAGHRSGTDTGSGPLRTGRGRTRECSLV